MRPEAARRKFCPFWIEETSISIKILNPFRVKGNPNKQLFAHFSIQTRIAFKSPQPGMETPDEARPERRRPASPLQDNGPSGVEALIDRLDASQDASQDNSGGGVAAILQRRGDAYLVSWVGYDASSNSWERMAALPPDMVEAFEDDAAFVRQQEQRADGAGNDEMEKPIEGGDQEDDEDDDPEDDVPVILPIEPMSYPPDLTKDATKMVNLRWQASNIAASAAIHTGVRTSYPTTWTAYAKWHVGIYKEVPPVCGITKLMWMTRELGTQFVCQRAATGMTAQQVPLRRHNPTTPLRDRIHPPPPSLTPPPTHPPTTPPCLSW